MTAASSRDDFGAGSLLLADSRLAGMLLNQGRYALLQRVFGVPREHANAVTFAILLTLGSAAAAKTGEIMRSPFHPSDFATGAFLARSGAVGIAGPKTGEVPGSV